MSITRLSRRTVYQNRWMKVHEDRIRFPDGSEGIYGLVDKPDFALIVPIRDDGRLQLVRQYRYPVEGRYWEFPQGSWETKPEADPADVARGELAEETGFSAGEVDAIGFVYASNGTMTQGCHVFRARRLSPGKPRPDPEEQDLETAPFTRAEIAQMIAGGEIRDSATLAALVLLDAAG